MQLSFLQDRESGADEWEPEELQLPLVAPWPRPLSPVAIEIDAPETDSGRRGVIIIDLA